MGNMKKLSLYKKYSAAEIGEELNLSKRLTNGIRKNFGDQISLYELKQINWSDFRACKGFGLKSWYKFRDAMSQIEDADKAVKVIDKRHHPEKIIVEINISEPFDKVIQDLSQIITKRK